MGLPQLRTAFHSALYSATKEHEIRFHQFQRGTSDRIRYKRANELRQASKARLAKLARDLDVKGRSKMSQRQPADAVAKAQESIAA